MLAYAATTELWLYEYDLSNDTSGLVKEIKDEGFKWDQVVLLFQSL